MAALARRTWATAQTAPALLAHLEWWRAYYHVVRPHKSLRMPLVKPIERGGRCSPWRYRQQTPAMAAGLTRWRWTVRALLLVPTPPEPSAQADDPRHHTVAGEPLQVLWRANVVRILSIKHHVEDKNHPQSGWKSRSELSTIANRSTEILKETRIGNSTRLVS